MLACTAGCQRSNCLGSGRALVLLLLIERVEVPDHLAQARRVQMGVNLRRLDASMSKELT